ncbi:MAG: hypothetical protein QGH45_12350 [Myxococcota bacterium]|jgi:hypothetical protein|nr:hypothetical protein [Myxococcota bacterium]
MRGGGSSPAPGWRRSGGRSGRQLDTDLLPSNVGTGLVFEFVQICRRTPGIHEIVYGPHSRYDEALCRFKEGMGFPPVAMPARYHLNPAAAALIRRRRPDMYYYISGELA